MIRMLRFWKMQAQGNDFVFLDRRFADWDDAWGPNLAVSICDRHFGIGADGLVVLVKPKAGGQIRMLIWNSDGSPADICGSALRCLIGWLGSGDGAGGLMVETRQGLHWGGVTQSGPRPLVRVEMGRARHIGEVEANGIRGDRIDMENPHLVVFRTDLSDQPATRLGPEIEHGFEGGMNVHFAQVVDGTHVRLETWERGAGATMACGSGSCATVWSAHRKGLVGTRVQVRQPGGEVRVEIAPDGALFLEGAVEKVFEGEYPF
jgi:diaminopimelate epimerase